MRKYTEDAFNGKQALGPVGEPHNSSQASCRGKPGALYGFMTLDRPCLHKCQICYAKKREIMK